MNLLRAKVKNKNDWWELALLDLAIVADGASEDAMLRDLEHSLIVDYHLALKANQTPFVRLFRGCPAEVSRSWIDGGKNFRALNLPQDVSMSLGAVFRAPNIAQFTVENVSPAA
jgi:hypothetical protein